MSLDALVLDAAQRPSLVTVRSLGRNGIRVGTFDVIPNARSPVPAFGSRWNAASGVLPDFAEDPESFCAAISELVDRHSPKVIIPIYDGTVEMLRRYRDQLQERVAIALAEERALVIAVSKPRSLALADQLGVPTPRSAAIHDLPEISAAVAEVGLPAVIKPARSWVEHNDVGRRLDSAVAVNRVELDRICEQMFSAGTDVLLQEWLPGRREAVWLLYADGRFWARFAQVAHRMFPPLGGSSVVRESIAPPPDILDSSESLVAAAGLSGFSEVEFRRDASGTAKLMEVNPRLSASIELAVRAGVDFPLLLYHWAAGDTLKPVTTYRYGVRMRWLVGDLLWLNQTLRNQGRPDSLPGRRAIWVVGSDFFRPSGYDYFALSDPRPAMIAMTRFAGRARRRMLRHWRDN